MAGILSARAERGSPSRPRQGDKRLFTIGFDPPLPVSHRWQPGWEASPQTLHGRTFRVYPSEQYLFFHVVNENKTAFHNGWPHLSAGGTFYHIRFGWCWDKLSRVCLLTSKSHFSHEVGGCAVPCPLFQPAPLMSCARRFCPSSDILCSCDLYSTPQPLSFSLPSCPIRFYPLVALAHCPFVSRVRTNGRPRSAHEHAPA